MAIGIKATLASLWPFASFKSAGADDVFATSGASKTLTGSLVTGDAIAVAAHSTVRFLYDYVKGGSATSMDMEVLYSIDGTNWYTEDYLSVPSSGVVTVDDNLINLTATRSSSFVVSTAVLLYVTIRARENGTAGGTLLVRALGGVSL